MLAVSRDAYLRRDVPFDRHLVDRRLGLVPAVGDDGDAAAKNPSTDQCRVGDRELDGRDDARLAADGFEIVALHLAAIDGAGLDGRPFRAGQLNIDAVDGFAGDFRRDIEILLLGAHQRPFGRRLDADALGIRMRRLSRERRNLAVGGGAARRTVGDDAVGGAHLFDRHVPDLGGREQQPLARFGAGELKIVAAVLHRRGGVGAHAPIEAVRNSGEAGAVAVAEVGLAAAVGVGRAVAHDVERPGRRHFPARRDWRTRIAAGPCSSRIAAPRRPSSRSRSTRPGRARSGRCGWSRCRRAPPQPRH